MLVQDNAVTVANEATITGWEVCTAVSSPVGTGSGQFPTPAQQLTTGVVVARKSASADGTLRHWVCAADATTCYFWSLTGDAASVYWHWGFGDIFSFNGSGDLYRCMIFGASASNTGNVSPNALYHPGDVINANANGSNPPLNLSTNHFMARTWGGGGSSIVLAKLADVSLTPGGPVNGQYSVTPQVGAVASPNGPDNSLYLSTIRLGELSGNIRGRMRGQYLMGHSSSSFADGQTFAGAGDFAGKTFRIIKGGPNGGFWCIETSNTVETN
jgi:hypothetical protein